MNDESRGTKLNTKMVSLAGKVLWLPSSRTSKTSRDGGPVISTASVLRPGRMTTVPVGLS